MIMHGTAFTYDTMQTNSDTYEIIDAVIRLSDPVINESADKKSKTTTPFTFTHLFFLSRHHVKNGKYVPSDSNSMAIVGEEMVESLAELGVPNSIDPKWQDSGEYEYSPDAPDDLPAAESVSLTAAAYFNTFEVQRLETEITDARQEQKLDDTKIARRRLKGLLETRGMFRKWYREAKITYPGIDELKAPITSPHRAVPRAARNLLPMDSMPSKYENEDYPNKPIKYLFWTDLQATAKYLQKLPSLQRYVRGELKKAGCHTPYTLANVRDWAHHKLQLPRTEA